MSVDHTKAKVTWWQTIFNKGMKWWNYVSTGVWTDTRKSVHVDLIKTLNLSVRSFLSVDLQSSACALTYRMLLAIVPALALLFAIGRGFGFQNILTSQLFTYFPSQREALQTAINFVDSYLAQASEGLFVGVGILFLLWTLISLLSSVEDVFNRIWGVKCGRSIWRKITDYTAIFLVLPVLMICSSGLSIFMSTTLVNSLPFKFMTPAITAMLDIASVVLTWLFFTGVYMLIPNTKVKFKNALISGVIAGIGFQVVQWLFVSGQMYVSKYNAIYGGFAFVPLLLIWMQLVWIICLTGAVICYSSQNIFQFSFSNQVSEMAIAYKRKVAVAIMAVTAQRFKNGKSPLRPDEYVKRFNLPTRLVEQLVSELEDAGLISRVVNEHTNTSEELAIQPAFDVNSMTVGSIIQALDNNGSSDFIRGFAKNFANLDKMVQTASEAMYTSGDATLLTEVSINTN